MSPVRVALTAAEPIVALTVRNAGDEPAIVQLHAMSWRQQGGSDHYEPTRALIATPPIFTVPPHGSQIVRIGLRHAVDSRLELTYRVYLQEVPPPLAPGFVGMQVAMRLGVPVFVTPAVTGPQNLQWQIRLGDDGQWVISCQNNGIVHARIGHFSVAANSITLLTQQVSADLHAGQGREWVVRSKQLRPAAGTALRLSVVTEQGGVDADLLAP